MSLEEQLVGIPYAYEAGPRPVHQLLYEPRRTNCQGFLQQFIALRRHIGMYPDLMRSMEAYQDGLGQVVADGLPLDLYRPQFHFGDVLFAARRQEVAGLDQRRVTALLSESGFLKHLHIAIWLGRASNRLVLREFPRASAYFAGRGLEEEPLVVHATNVDGGEASSVWTATRFTEYYFPVRVRRLFGVSIQA